MRYYYFSHIANAAIWVYFVSTDKFFVGHPNFCDMLWSDYLVFGNVQFRTSNASTETL